MTHVQTVNIQSSLQHLSSQMGKIVTLRKRFISAHEFNPGYLISFKANSFLSNECPKI